MLPGVHNKAVVFKSFQERIKRSPLDTCEAVPSEDLSDGIAMTFPMAEHRKHRLRERRARQLRVKVKFFHNLDSVTN